MHHLGRGNLNGARAQLTKSLEKLRQYPETFCRIDNGKLVADLQATLDDLRPWPISISRLGGG
jgi:hypothetical protein